MKEKINKVIIIGAGIAGLSSAVRMAARGYQVEVFEATDKIGGKLNQFELNGYRFDAGPSLFTMPQYVTELFTIAGKQGSDYFQYDSLDVICNYFWEDGTRCSTYKDFDKTIKELSEKLFESQQKLKEHFDDSALKYQLTGKTFLENTLHSFKTWLSLDVVKALTKLHKLDVLGTMHGVNQKRFKNPKTIQLFDRYATYNGSNPYKAPGLLNIIPHFEYGFGAYIPKKGMYEISESIYKLCIDLGVKFHLNTKVSNILKETNKVAGIQTVKGAVHKCDIVISNMDAYYTYLHLLNQKEDANDILKQERSSSALIFYWGIKNTFKELDLHNIFFSNDYEHEFACISKGEISNDPTIYINITSKYVQNDAPKGCENWFTMINVPYNKDQNWELLIAHAKKNILTKLSRILGREIESLIVCEDILDPRSIESKTMSYTGSLYGTSSNSKWAAFARHPNQSPQYNNLFFIGGSVHPGGGVPLCLLSSKIVDDIIHG
ncbi:MAG TPA: phytoene desaturase family protein [Saprospiraceae bacterium]|nr:phytoene desaturase family protein [Saprospiraceae bacterium]